MSNIIIKRNYIFTFTNTINRFKTIANVLFSPVQTVNDFFLQRNTHTHTHTNTCKYTSVCMTLANSPRDIKEKEEKKGFKYTRIRTYIMCTRLTKLSTRDSTHNKYLYIYVYILTYLYIYMYVVNSLLLLCTAG